MEHRREVRCVSDLQITYDEVAGARRPVCGWSFLFDNSWSLLRHVQVFHDPLYAVEVELQLREHPSPVS